MSRELTLCPNRQRVQDVDRPAHVQAFPQPTWHRRPRVNAKPLRLMPRSQNVDGVVRQLWRRRHFGQRPAIRAPESELAVGLSLDVVTLLVNGAMVPATEQGQVRERRGATVGPVADVMALAGPKTTAREAAAAVSMVERPS